MTVWRILCLNYASVFFFYVFCCSSSTFCLHSFSPFIFQFLFLVSMLALMGLEISWKIKWRKKSSSKETNCKGLSLWFGFLILSTLSEWIFTQFSASVRVAWLAVMFTGKFFFLLTCPFPTDFLSFDLVKLQIFWLSAMLPPYINVIYTCNNWKR